MGGTDILSVRDDLSVFDEYYRGVQAPLPFTSLFSFYGGKSKTSVYYPPPRYDTIIEPFAGGASYALRYHDRHVILSDRDPVVMSIWEYLIGTDLDDMLSAIPESVTAGMRVSDLVPSTAPRGLIELLRSEANHGTQGIRSVRDVVTIWAARDWPRLRRRIRFWHPRIRHWTIRCVDYQRNRNRRATWFVDPPYANPAGALYRVHQVDYRTLAAWCRERMGQVIVCEQATASWLPFQGLTFTNGSRRGVDQEMLWVRD